MDTTVMHIISKQSATNTQEAGTINPLHVLIVRAAAGDKRAIGNLARTCESFLLAIAALALGPIADEAPDVVQDFYLMLLDGGIRTCPNPENAVHWMVEGVKCLAQARRAAARRMGGERGAVRFRFRIHVLFLISVRLSRR